MFSTASALALAGEIIILQPAAGYKPGNTEKARQLNDSARRNAGQAVPGEVFLLDQGNLEPDTRPPGHERMERSLDEAHGYADPPPYRGDSGSPVILRAAPLSNAERSRQKARSYVTEQPKAAVRNCGAVTNQVGTIGEGSGSHRSENVIEKGSSTVDSNCR